MEQCAPRYVNRPILYYVNQGGFFLFFLHLNSTFVKIYADNKNKYIHTHTIFYIYIPIVILQLQYITLQYV